MREALEQAKRKTKEIDADFIEKDTITWYRRQRASTLTSPSGRHLGHQKAILKQDGSPKELMKESMNQVFGTQTELMNIAFKHGMSYP